MGTDIRDFRRFEKIARLDPSKPDSLADRLDVLANPLRDWPALSLSEAKPVEDADSDTGTASEVVALPKPVAVESEAEVEVQAEDMPATVANLDAHRPKRTPRSISSELPAPEEGRLTDFARGPNAGTESRGW